MPAGRAAAVLRWGCAAAAGVALDLAAAPANQPWCAPLGVALLTLLCHPGIRLRRAAGYALVTGWCWLTPLLAWSRAPGVAPWLALATLEAALVAPLGVLTVLVRRAAAPGWLRAGAVAAGWVADEAVRDRWPFGGFPWARLAFTQADAPLLRWARWGGAPLVTVAVAAIGVATAAALAAAGRRRWGAAGAAALVVLAGWCAPLLVPLPRPGGPDVVRVAVVQGNVPRLGYSTFRQKRAVLAGHVRLSLQLAADVAAGRQPRPDLVVWPENAADLDPYRDAPTGRALTAVARALGEDVLVGAVLDGPRQATVYNAGIVVRPDGTAPEAYLKRRPVPFGEALPARGVFLHLPGVAALVRRLLPNQFLPGHGTGVVHPDHVAVGDVICYEVAFDGLVHDDVAAGARILVVQTNNATFGRSAESAQQVAMARLRAVEHDRSVLVASTSGESAVISPAGRLVRRSALFTVALLQASVPLRSTRTPAERWGRTGEAALSALAAGLVGLGLAAGGPAPAGRRQRRQR